MKAQKKLNILLVVLIIILISLISFVGIFHQDKSEMTNIIPKYILGTNVSGYRLVTLNLSTDDEENKDDAEAEKTVEKIGTAEEYRKCAEIITNRLKQLKVENFEVSVDENSGEIEIKVPENSRTDTILSDITQKGNFQIVDSITGEVLLSNADVRKASMDKDENIYYTVAYMSINFNNKGARTLKNITSNYQNQIVENIAENSTSNKETGATSSQEDDTQKESEVKTKQITVKIDDSTLLTTYFNEIIENGVLKLTLGTSTDSEQTQNLMDAGANIAAIIQNEVMPLQYSVSGNMYIKSNISIEDIKVMIYVEIAIALIIMLFMIIKYKGNGIWSGLLSVGFIATLLIIIRLTNVVLSIEGILGIALIFVMNMIFNYYLLKQIKDAKADEQVKIFDKSLKKYSIVTMPIAIVAVVCSFVNIENLYSFGMVMFWGIIISLLYNLIFTNIVIRNKK